MRENNCSDNANTSSRMDSPWSWWVRWAHAFIPEPITVTKYLKFATFLSCSLTPPLKPRSDVNCHEAPPLVQHRLKDQRADWTAVISKRTVQQRRTMMSIIIYNNNVEQ